MDPSLYHLDWEQLTEVLATVVVLAFVIERALALLFESRLFVRTLGTKGVKEPIAFAAALLVCWHWKLDALGVILHGEKVQFLGEIITAAVIAGGSKASLKLFRDVLGIESDRAKEARLTAAKGSKAEVAKQPGTP